MRPRTASASSWLALPFSTARASCFSILPMPFCERRLVDLAQHHLVAGLRRHLGDAVTHQARSEHSHLLDLLRHLTSARVARFAAGNCAHRAAAVGVAGKRSPARDGLEPIAARDRDVGGATCSTVEPQELATRAAEPASRRRVPAAPIERRERRDRLRRLGVRGARRACSPAPCCSPRGRARRLGHPFIGPFKHSTDRRQHRAGERRPEPLRDRHRARQTSARSSRGDIADQQLQQLDENQQGTGTTIVQITPARARCRCSRRSTPPTLPGPVPGRRRPDDGAGDAARQGYVVVGSLPTDERHSRDGEGRLPDRAQQQRPRRSRRSPARPINGPWDMTAVSQGTVQHAVRHERAQRHGRPRRNADRRRHGRADRACARAPTVTRRVVTPMHVIADRLPRAHRRSGAGGRPDGRRRSATTARCTWPTRRATASPRSRTRSVRHARHGRRHDGRRRRLPEQPARPDDRAQRRHPHGERRRRQHRRDDTVRR